MAKLIGRAAQPLPAKPPEATTADLKLEVNAVHEVFPYIPPSDPRPDLFVDSRHWEQLLTALWLADGADAEDSPQALAFWCIEAVRCLGAALIVGDGRARIRHGQMSENEYERVKRDWLQPNLDTIRPFLENPTWARISQ